MAPRAPGSVRGIWVCDVWVTALLNKTARNTVKGRLFINNQANECTGLLQIKFCNTDGTPTKLENSEERVRTQIAWQINELLGSDWTSRWWISWHWPRGCFFVNYPILHAGVVLVLMKQSQGGVSGPWVANERPSQRSTRDSVYHIQDVPYWWGLEHTMWWYPWSDKWVKQCFYVFQAWTLTAGRVSIPATQPRFSCITLAGCARVLSPLGWHTHCDPLHTPDHGACVIGRGLLMMSTAWVQHSSAEPAQMPCCRSTVATSSLHCAQYLSPSTPTPGLGPHVMGLPRLLQSDDCPADVCRSALPAHKDFDRVGPDMGRADRNTREWRPEERKGWIVEALSVRSKDEGLSPSHRVHRSGGCDDGWRDRWASVFPCYVLSFSDSM